jgi:hypothetical protein
MANQSSKAGPEFVAGDQTAENIRRKFIEAPLEAAQQSALNTSLEIASLLSIIPDAFLASQRRELERVKKSGTTNDIRITILQTSIEQAGVLHTTAQRGEARAQRAFAALADNDSVFHGFVSDAELNPLKGLTVRLIDEQGTRAKGLSTITMEDGYFRIVLGVKSDTVVASKDQATQPTMSQRIIDMMSGLSREPSSASDTSTVAGGSRVEILKNGKVRHSDPVPLSPDNGSVYREYVIAGT